MALTLRNEGRCALISFWAEGLSSGGALLFIIIENALYRSDASVPLKYEILLRFTDLANDNSVDADISDPAHGGVEITDIRYIGIGVICRAAFLNR